jgi:hypothetical protein
MNKLILIFIALIVSFMTGCMEIENRIIMQLDGGAIIKETILVHKELLDFTDEAGSPVIMKYLEKSACEERAKAFGKGTVLLNHSIKNLNDGVKSLEAEYKIDDINELYVINPYLCYTNYKEMGLAKFSFKPILKSGNGYGTAGNMALNIVTEKPGIGQKTIGRGEPKVSPPSPKILQKFRNWQPIIKDCMKDFKISVMFECYSSVYPNYGLRERPSQPRKCEILSFSGSDYDNLGGLLLDNDEIMQELLRLKFWDYNFIKAAQDFENNLTVPVICDGGSPYQNYGTGGRVISFKPSKAIFDKYLAGKKIDYSIWQSDPKNIVDADFSKIGFDPAKDTMKAALKLTPQEPEGGVKKAEESK